MRFAVDVQELDGMCTLSASRLPSSQLFFLLASLYHPPGSVSSYKANIHISKYSCSCRCCGCSQQQTSAISRESFHPVSSLGFFSIVKIFASRTNSVIIRIAEIKWYCRFKTANFKVI